jgi:Transglutaminase-like superfamily
MLERARLAGEIAGSYLCARRALRRAPISAVVTELRLHGSRSPPHRSGDRLIAPHDRLIAPHDPLVRARDPLVEARHLGSAVTRTLALLPGDTRCLVRSLVLTRLLARRGIPATLVIATRTTPSFAAHAWVEHAGRPVLPPGDRSFGRIVEL